MRETRCDSASWRRVDHSQVLLAGVSRQIRRLLEVCREREWLRTDVEFDELMM